MQATDMQSILDLQRSAHLNDSFPTAKLREDRIRRMIAMLLDNRSEFCAAMDSDFNGRCSDMSSAVDFLPTINQAKHVLKHFKAWMKPERRSASFPFNIAGGKAEVRYLPLGVVGNISPWNFPVNLTFGPLPAIFAAGNRTMIKPSEFTEATSAVMAELVPRYFDQSELAVVLGDAAVAAEFSSLAFDHLLFTGSTSVAHHVMVAASKNLVPVTLELGGKSPVVISRSADINDAARKIIFGKTLNAGQICLAPDYLLIPEDMQDAMISAMQAEVKKMYPSLTGNSEYTHIINCRHFQRLAGLLDDARARGADITPLYDDACLDEEGRLLPPHILTNIPTDARILQEEIFGPLLAFRTYQDFSEIKAIIDSGERPLALYYFGNNEKEVVLLRDQVISGGMVVNDVLAHYMQENLPFGGVGASGMGMYHGVEGFRNFSHVRSIYRQAPLDIGRFIRPPFAKGRRIVDS